MRRGNLWNLPHAAQLGGRTGTTRRSSRHSRCRDVRVERRGRAGGGDAVLQQHVVLGLEADGRAQDVDDGFALRGMTAE